MTARQSSFCGGWDWEGEDTGGEAKVRKVCKARAGVHCKGEGQGVGRTEDLNMGRGS